MEFLTRLERLAESAGKVSNHEFGLLCDQGHGQGEDDDGL